MSTEDVEAVKQEFSVLAKYFARIMLEHVIGKQLEQIEGLLFEKINTGPATYSDAPPDRRLYNASIRIRSIVDTMEAMDRTCIENVGDQVGCKTFQRAQKLHNALFDILYSLHESSNGEESIARPHVPQVEPWYDQSGNGNHLSFRGTPLNEFRINAGLSEPLAVIGVDGIMRFKVDANDENAKKFVECVENFICRRLNGIEVTKHE